MATGLSACLVYLACAGFFQAGERRAQLVAVQDNINLRRGIYAGAWLLLLVAFWLAAGPQGWERGIPIWLGLLTAGGVVSLLVSALRPNWHLPSAIAATVLAVMFAVGAIFA